MSTVRVNSDESMRVARLMLRTAKHDWNTIRRASHRDEDGVVVVNLRKLKQLADSESARSGDE